MCMWFFGWCWNALCNVCACKTIYNLVILTFLKHFAYPWFAGCLIACLCYRMIVFWYREQPVSACEIAYFAQRFLTSFCCFRIQKTFGKAALWSALDWKYDVLDVCFIHIGGGSTCVPLNITNAQNWLDGNVSVHRPCYWPSAKLQERTPT